MVLDFRNIRILLLLLVCSKLSPKRDINQSLYILHVYNIITVVVHLKSEKWKSVLKNFDLYWRFLSPPNIFHNSWDTLYINHHHISPRWNMVVCNFGILTVSQTAVSSTTILRWAKQQSPPWLIRFAVYSLSLCGPDGGRHPGKRSNG